MRGLAKRVIACLDVRANDAGDLVVTKGDQYDVRDTDTHGNEVRASIYAVRAHVELLACAAALPPPRSLAPACALSCR